MPYTKNWFIQQHTNFNGEKEDYQAVVCTNSDTAGSSGTTSDPNYWVFCVQSDTGGGSGVSSLSSDGKALQVRAKKDAGGVIRSGRINSKRFQEFQPTVNTPLKFSSRIKIPVGAHGGGYWPAVWF